ncbi:MAG: hypothetical protein V4463_11410 [Pseudomonadota bacterium]
MIKAAHVLSGFMLLQCVGARSEGLPLRVCVSDQAAAPFTYPDREGLSHRTIRAAASKLQQAVLFEVKPRKRCLAEAQAGQVDALAMAGSTRELTATLAYPMRGDAIDPQRGFGPYQAYLVRYRGATLEWNGQQITGASLPVLYPAGMTAAHEKLQALGVDGNGSFKSAKDMGMLLLNRRAQAIVLREADALAVARDGAMRDQLELMQPAFFSINIYVPFSRNYYEAHREFVEKFWDELGRQQK